MLSIDDRGLCEYGEDWSPRLRFLEAENKRLAADLAAMKAILAPEIRLPRQWGLTRTEATIFRALVRSDCVSREGLYALLYCSRDEDKLPRSKWALDIHIHNLRSKLSGFKIDVLTIHAIGWALAPAVRSEWQGKMAERKAA